MRAFATVLVIPLAWAICFATFAAVGVDALALKGAGKLVDALIMPLVALALLWICASLPKTLDADGAARRRRRRRLVGRTASYIAARRADAVVAHAVPIALGGRHDHATSGSRNGEGMPAASGPSDATTPDSTSGSHTQTHVPPASSSAVAVGTRPGSERARAPQDGALAGARSDVHGEEAPAAQRSAWAPAPGFAHSPVAAPSSTSPGLRTPAWREIRERMPIELAAAATRQPQISG